MINIFVFAIIVKVETIFVTLLNSFYYYILKVCQKKKKIYNFKYQILIK